MNKPVGITVIGCGPGDSRNVSKQAWEIMSSADVLHFRTNRLPLINDLPATVKIESFDHLYDDAEIFEEVYESIIGSILKLGQTGVIYCVPGHPYVAESTAPEIVRRAAEQGIPCGVIDGISFLEPVFTALQVDPFDGLALLDAVQLRSLLTPPYPPSQAALIAQIYSREIASDVKLMLNFNYDDEFRVKLVHAAGTPDELIEDLALYEIDRSEHIGITTALYLPALERESSFEQLQEVIARLRAPDGCPWDREQTHLSLRQYLLEEAYETVEALDAEDPDKLKEELGDLLLQIVLHAQIASEEGEFFPHEVMAGISNKLVSRHPHVFGSGNAESVGDVLLNWEKLKADERKRKGEKARKGMLSGVSAGLPALIQAQQYQARTARVGFDWSEVEGVEAKIHEELAEFKQAAEVAEKEKEMGDLLFSVVNLSRWHGIDAESALRRSNTEFRKRFEFMEEAIQADGKILGELNQAELDIYWEEAKSDDNEH